jgi:parvulin-like peptidyl-prolyl isomerase
MNTLRTQNLRRLRSVPIHLLLLGVLTALAGPNASSQDIEPTVEEATEPAAQSEAEAEVIATVGTTRLTRADLEQAVRRRSGGRPVPADQQDRLQAQAVGDLVEQALLRAEIERRQVEVTDGEINDQIAQLSTELTARQSSLDAFLAGAGLDHEGLREQVRFELAVPKIILPMITEDVMRQVLAMHRYDFDGTRVRASHIILRPEASSGPNAITAVIARAERIRADILAEELTFAEAAERYSAGPSRHRGGDLGFLPRHGLLSEEFAAQVFKLTKGEVSKPFLTPVGIHVAKVTDVEPGRVGMDAVRSRLEKLLANRLIRELVAKGRQSTAVVYVPGVAHFDPATPPDGTEPRRVIIEGEEVAK